MITLESLDSLNYHRYILNSMSPEETLPLFNPWLMSIHDYSLSDQAPPALESLDRSLMGRAQLILGFNGLMVFLYVGRTCDAWYLNELFHVQEFGLIDRHMSEEEIFAPGVYESSAYLYALYNIINQQLRAQRQPFCELRILTEGDPESDSTFKSMLINDAISNTSYNIDFTKFLGTIMGGTSGPGAASGGTPAVGGPGASTHGYY